MHFHDGALDGDIRRAAQAVRQADLRQGPNEPLGRVPLPPTNGIAVVMQEVMVEVVVALAVGQEGEYRVVLGAVAVVVGLGAPHVRERIDEEGDVVADDQARDTGQ